MEKKKITPYNVNRKNKRFNANAPYSVFATRAVSNYMPNVSPTAYNIARFLASFYNSNSANGTVNPAENRIKYSLCLDDDAFAIAVEELATTGWFVPVRDDNGEVRQFLLGFEDYMYENYDMLKRMRSSWNHSKFDARYTKTENQLAKAIMGLATEKVIPIFDDLGYASSKKAGKKPPHLVKNGHLDAKLCHSTFFRHPMLRSDDPEVWKKLARMKNLPPNWTVDSMSVRFTVAELADKFLLQRDWDSLTEAVEAINDGGYWTAVVYESLGSVSEDVVVLTPTHKLHNAVWEIDNKPGGKNVIAWEKSHGFCEENYTTRRASTPMNTPPPRGYHYIYVVKSHKTGEYLLVGQTTQTLQARLNQHFYEGTNEDARARFLSIRDDPDDFLVIEPLSTVHYSIVHQQEMRAVRAMTEIGHCLLNKVRSDYDNWRTIRMDRRFTKANGYSRASTKILRAQQVAE